MDQWGDPWTPQSQYYLFLIVGDHRGFLHGVLHVTQLHVIEASGVLRGGEEK